MSVVDDSAPSSAPTIPTRAPAVQVRAAEVRAGDEVLLPAIDLTVDAGETVAIVGRSGAGKTTLLHLIAGLLAPTAGSVHAQPAALMPQHHGLMPWARASDNAALPLRISGVGRRAARAAAERQLAALGLGELAGRRVARLSGGERQRVALARTLLTGRPLVLLDEPLASVDALTRDELHELLLAHLRAPDRAAVLVTHDVDEAVRLGDRLLVLGPHGLRAPSVPLVGAPGTRLAGRGGEALRAAILTELGR